MTKLWLFWVLTASGCAGAWSVGAGPTIDTEGRVGLLVTGRVAVGLGADKTAYLVGFEGGVGPALDAGLGVGYGASAFDVARLEDDVVWRIGLRGGWAGRFGDGDVESQLVAGGSVAVLAPLAARRDHGHEKSGGGGRTVWGIGGELRALAAIPADEGKPTLGLFALSCTFESLAITRPF